MSETLRPFTSEPPTGESNTLLEYPNFDPPAARRAAANAMSESPVSPDFSPEEMKNSINVFKKLESFGADSRILNNPAVRERIENIIQEFGLADASFVEGKMNEEGREFSLSCFNGPDAERSSDAHDRASFKFSVSSRFGAPAVSVSAAYLDRSDAVLPKDRIPTYQNPDPGDYLDITGNIACIRDKNVATITHFVIPQDDKLIEIIKEDSVEEQYTPVRGAKSHNITQDDIFYTATKAGRNSFFDANGEEVSREDTKYQDVSASISKAAFFGARNGLDLAAAPNHLRASYALLDGINVVSQEIKQTERIQYVRNPDNTMNIEGYRFTDGKKLLLENRLIQNDPETNASSRSLIPETPIVESDWTAA